MNHYQNNTPLRKMNVGMLVWSFISMFLTLPYFPTGIIALVNTIKARQADSDELERRLLHVAKKCNIASIVLGVVLEVIITVMVAVFWGLTISLLVRRTGSV